MAKQVTSEKNQEGTPLYSHLEPIVDFLLSDGNSLTNKYRWGSNWDGYYCDLTKAINFSRLEEVFDFPKSIMLAKERNVIFCEKTRCVIKTAPTKK